MKLVNLQSFAGTFSIFPLLFRILITFFFIVKLVQKLLDQRHAAKIHCESVIKLFQLIAPFLSFMI